MAFGAPGCPLPWPRTLLWTDSSVPSTFVPPGSAESRGRSSVGAWGGRGRRGEGSWRPASPWHQGLRLHGFLSDPCALHPAGPGLRRRGVLGRGSPPLAKWQTSGALGEGPRRDQDPELGRPDVAGLQAGGAAPSWAWSSRAPPPRGAGARRAVGPLSAVAGFLPPSVSVGPFPVPTPTDACPAVHRYLSARGVRASSEGFASGSALSPQRSAAARWPGRSVRPSEGHHCQTSVLSPPSRVVSDSHLGSPGLDSTLAFLSPHFLARDPSRLTLQQDHRLSSADSFQVTSEKTHGRENGRARPGFTASAFRARGDARVAGRGVRARHTCAPASGVCPKAHKFRGNF